MYNVVFEIYYTFRPTYLFILSEYPSIRVSNKLIG